MKKIYCLVITILLFSCSKELDPQEVGLLMSDTEVVNGMKVHWQNYMTEERRQVIRDILNDMVLVEGGIFTMGTSRVYDSLARDNESPQHIVRVSNFYICAHELSYHQVNAIMPVTRSSNIRDYNYQYLFFSWDDWSSVLFSMKDMTGITFDFPTEAQWEYVARGGNKSNNYLFPGSNVLSAAWSSELFENNTSLPNELGMYNMADKNAEWCKDYYQSYIVTAMVDNPCVMTGKGHVVRGGCHISSSEYKHWYSSASSTYMSFSNSLVDWRMCRSTARCYYSQRSWDIGCRPVINISR